MHGPARQSSIRKQSSGTVSSNFPFTGINGEWMVWGSKHLQGSERLSRSPVSHCSFVVICNRWTLLPPLVFAFFCKHTKYYITEQVHKENMSYYPYLFSTYCFLKFFLAVITRELWIKAKAIMDVFHSTTCGNCNAITESYLLGNCQRTSFQGKEMLLSQGHKYNKKIYSSWR